jgi:ethanolamine utilization microcompartment shell protein EutL
MPDLAQKRQQAHALLDQLPPQQLAAVRSLLETMLDPIDRKLALARMDDEPETEEERQAVAAAVESLQRNGGVPMETVLADFGLTMEEFRHVAETDSPVAKQA